MGTKIHAKSVYGAPFNPEFAEADPWTVTLTYQRRRMTVPLYMGSGHNGAEPTASSVVESLALDTAGVENAISFEDWCAEYGYDTDSRKAERIYRECERNAKRFRRFLGAEADSIIYGDENTIRALCEA